MTVFLKNFFCVCIFLGSELDELLFFWHSPSLNRTQQYHLFVVVSPSHFGVHHQHLQQSLLFIVNVIDACTNTSRQYCNQLCLIYCLFSFSMHCVVIVTAKTFFAASLAQPQLFFSQPPRMV